MTELPIILDDVIDCEIQNQIEDSFFDCFFTYCNDNSLGSKTNEMKYRKFVNPLTHDVTPAFLSNILFSKNIRTYRKIYPLIKKSCDKINFKLEKIYRCYGAIHALIKKSSKIDNIHINHEIPHLVMLYYVNDCDGDTILYDKKRGDIPFTFDGYLDEYCKFNITHRISPKRGRVVFFDGATYHSSSSPTKSIRCILTLDLFGQFMDGTYKFPEQKQEEENNINHFDYR